MTTHTSGPLSRRRFLTRSLLVGLGLAATPALGALAACSPGTPQPDAALLELLGSLRALAGTGTDGGTGMFSTQSQRLADEAVRQCGTDPESTCTASVDDAPVPSPAPQVADVRRQITLLLPDAVDRDQASLLSGVFAALSTVDDRTAGSPAIDWAVAGTRLGDDGSSRRKKAAGALADATARIHEAVWLTGRVLPTAGTAVTAVNTVGDRLRRIRDVAVAVTEVSAAPGYTFPSGSSAPTDATGSATLLLSAVHGVTVEMRRAVSAVAAEDRVTVNMWCAVSARCEAALEDALGRDPLSVAVRGE